MLVLVDRPGYYSLEKIVGDWRFDGLSDGHLRSRKEVPAAEAVETSVINSLSQDYSNQDDLLSPTCTDFPGFKLFTLKKRK